MRRQRFSLGVAVAALLLVLGCGGGGGDGDGGDGGGPDGSFDGGGGDAAADGGSDGGLPDGGDGGMAGECDPPCPAGQLCRFETCVPDLGTCADNDDCPGDSYCSDAGECLPYGVPPEVTNDPTCVREMVLDEVLPTVQCEWEGPPDSDPEPRSRRIYTAPMVADLNLDLDPDRLQPSIVVTTFYSDPDLDSRIGTLRVFDGRTCEEQLQLGGAGEATDENRPAYGTQWAVIDLDGDVAEGGHPELVGLHRTSGTGNPPLNLYAVELDASGATPTASRMWYGRDCETGTPVEIADNQANFGPGAWDLDGDASPEIVIGENVFDSEGCLLNTLTPVTYITHGPMNTVADVDLDGVPELVTGERIAEWDEGSTEWVDESYFGSGAAHRPGHVAVVDLGQYSERPGRPTPNELPEIVVVSAETNAFDPDTTGTIRVQRLDGTVIFGPIDLHHSAGVAGGHGGAPTASDFDGDGQAEFAAAANEFYAVYDPDCDADPDTSPAERPGGACDRPAAMAGLPDGVLWAQPSSDFSSSGTGSSIFDFNGDGSGEAVYRDECYMRVYDGATGEVLFSSPASSGTGFDLPVVADVDGDFATEIVVARTAKDGCPATDPIFEGGETHSQSDGFVILRDPEDRWASSRPIWNQHAYSVTHVTDDAQVVSTPAWVQNWTVESLNNFRQNVQGDLGTLDIADLTVVFFDIAAVCEADFPAELTLRAQVCNRGTNPVSDGVLVEFSEMPEDGGASSVVCETRSSRLLEPGECEEVSCTGEVTDVERLGVRVDPDDEIADCHPGNNDGAAASRFCLI